MAAFSEYIKGIIFFVIFASFVGIILPSGKYKNYINIVLGFIVVFLVFAPVAKIDESLQLNELVYGMDARISQTAMKNSSGIYEAKRQEMIVEAFEQQMREQVSRLLESSDYKLISLMADIDLETGELNALTLTVSKDEIAAIEPVKIGKSAKDSQADDKAVENIKNIISDFYNLSISHIYVNVQGKK